MVAAQRTVILGLIALGALAMAGTAKSQPEPAGGPQSTADIPLAGCTVEKTLDVDYRLSMQRNAAPAHLSLIDAKELDKLIDSLPNRGANLLVSQVSKLLNSRQRAEFEQLKVQMIMQNMDHLAESRLQHDDMAMLGAAAAIRAIARRPSQVSSKLDPNGEGASLVWSLFRSLKGNQKALFPVPDPTVCSIDLALYKQATTSMSTALLLMQSPEARMLLQLQKKYRVNGRLDPNKLPSPDKEEAIRLTKAIGNPIGRGLETADAWANLLWYAKASQLEYKSLRNDVANGRGSLKYDYAATINRVFASASPATKHAIIAWNVVDKTDSYAQQTLMRRVVQYVDAIRRPAAK